MYMSYKISIIYTYMIHITYISNINILYNKL